MDPVYCYLMCDHIAAVISYAFAMFTELLIYVLYFSTETAEKKNRRSVNTCKDVQSRQTETIFTSFTKFREFRLLTTENSLSVTIKLFFSQLFQSYSMNSSDKKYGISIHEIFVIRISVIASKI